MVLRITRTSEEAREIAAVEAAERRERTAAERERKHRDRELRTSIPVRLADGAVARVRWNKSIGTYEELLRTRSEMRFKDLPLAFDGLRGDIPAETRECPCGDGAVYVEVEDGDHALRVDVRCARCAKEWDVLTRKDDGAPVGANELVLRRKTVVDK